jgi:glycosyltransferase involved in cell wall biosynthesis
MKVSVIIPAYNAIRYLPETLSSVFNQTFSDLEIVIVNDGSTDETERWVKQQTDPRLRVISQENKGASKARNTGILNSEGEYLAFLDSDDLWAPSKLERQVKVLDTYSDTGLVYTWVTSIDEKGVSRGRQYKNFAEGKIWETLVFHNVLECGSTPLVRRSCFEEVGMFDETLTNVEDRDMWLRIARFYDFKVVKEPLVYYRQHPSSKGKNWPLVERSANSLLEKAFKDPPTYINPSKLKSLKRKSYGMVYLRLAWKPLKSSSRDYREAFKLQQQSIQYWPLILVRKDYIRLILTILLVFLLGSKNYDQVMSIFYFFRRQTIH